jgi:hypothetical protein
MQEADRMLGTGFRIFLISLILATINNSQFLSFPVRAAESGNRNEEGLSANIRGQVKEEGSENPVAGAFITIPSLDLSIPTDSEGRFEIQDITIKEEVSPITVNITAEGYGKWTLQDVPLVAGDTLILTPKLTSSPYLSIVPSPRADQPDKFLDQQIEIQSLAAPPPLPASLPLPENIRVRISGSPYSCSTSRPYTVKVINFKQYAKNVLPNEWGARWPADSLRAGATAVKMYAWFMIARGGKWKDADVWDSTCDQVYNPNFEFESTSAAVDTIWDSVFSQKGEIFPSYYRAYYYQCEDAGLAGSCMGQWDSKDLADDGYSWDRILYSFYKDTKLAKVSSPAVNGYSLRFNGDAKDYRENRVLLQLQDPDVSPSSLPVNIGANSFSIEWWLKADLKGNSAPAITCSSNNQWIKGNIILDQSIEGLPRSFGVSIAGGRLAFGISNDAGERRTICSKSQVTDGRWHHVAIQRRISDGTIWLFLDGRLEASVDGPDGDLSYPDTHVALLETDPYLGIGAWKNEAELSLYPFFYGWIDELRISKGIRYTQSFIPPSGPFQNDADTLALYHFNEGIGDLITDSSGAQGGPSHGSRETGSPSLGGDPEKGSEWERSDLFQWLFLPLTIR